MVSAIYNSLNSSSLLDLINSKSGSNGSSNTSSDADVSGDAVAVSRGSLSGKGIKSPIKVGPDISTTTVSAASIAGAAGSFKMSIQIKALDDSQKQLAADLKTAMGKSGAEIRGNVDFSLSSKGAVEIKAENDADKAAVTDFLKNDTSQPRFVTRIASQAKQAMDLSSVIQQSAAISQASRSGVRATDVMSLYTSLMQHVPTTTTVFSVSAAASSLSYPGALTAQG